MARENGGPGQGKWCTWRQQVNSNQKTEATKQQQQPTLLFATVRKWHWTVMHLRQEHRHCYRLYLASCVSLPSQPLNYANKLGFCVKKNLNQCKCISLQESYSIYKLRCIYWYLHSWTNTILVMAVIRGKLYQ